MDLQLPDDFKEFLKLLNSHGVEYLLIGGYAVGCHGYPRATGDLDIWIAIDPQNADRLVAVFREFGFAVSGLNRDLFLEPGSMVRIGNPPIRIEIITDISGAEFENCYPNRVRMELDGIPIDVINMDDLRSNKRASGRPKDMDDLKNLP